VKLKASVLLASALVSTAAFAQEAKPEETKPAESKVEKMVTPYGVLQSTMKISDTQENNTPSFSLYTARFGLKISEGIAKGQLELQFSGNKDADEKSNKAVVRRADAGFDFASGTSVRLGRFRLGGAAGWGVDASGTPTAFGPTDGAMVAQAVDLGEGNMLKFQLGLGNTLAAFPFWDKPLFDPAYGPSDDFNSDGTSKRDRAILASLDATVAGVSLAAYYGYEGKQTKVTKAVVDNALTPEDESIAAATTYRSVGHLELSAGYNMEGIGAGVWYERWDAGATKNAVVNNVNFVEDKTQASPSNAKVTASRIGLGVNGDSTLFDVSDLAQKGDKFTYGLSYVLTQQRDSTKTDSEETKTDENAVAAGVGYNAGGLTLELDYLYKTAKNKIYTNPNATVAKDNAQVVYLTSIYSF
jgi:predicted porin